jgi:hypothetical protein
MNCREFRQLHGDWVDDVLDPAEGDTVSGHIAVCAPCARFDVLARRALMVARNAPQIEVSADFSARLAARIAEERRGRIAAHAPSHVERAPVLPRTGAAVWMRRAAVVAAVAGGSLLVRATSATPPLVATEVRAAEFDSTPLTRDSSSPFGAELGGASLSSLMGDIIVVRPMRPVRGALMPVSDDPLLDGRSLSGIGEGSATSVAATAPLWPTAQMAAHAANRFAAMEFGDVTPVSAVQTSR